MSVVRAHGVGVDGVQFSAPRQETNKNSPLTSCFCLFDKIFK